MAKKIELKLEIIGLENWNNGASTLDSIMALFSIKVDIREGVAKGLGIDMADVKITNIELINDQPETPTE